MSEYQKAVDAAQDKAVVESDRLAVSKSLGIDPKTAPVAGHVEFASDGATGLPPIGRRRGQLSEEAKTRLDLMLNIERRLRMQTIRPATVINMLPFPLKIASPLYDDLVPPACPEGNVYESYTIRRWKFDWADQGNEKYLPVELVPIVLAREFESYFYKYGGVVVYEGNHDPLSDPALVEKLKDAKARMVDYFRELFAEAEREYLLPNKQGIGNIGETHRKAAAYLLRERYIQEKPAWLELTRAEKDIAEPCPRCKAEPKKGAYMCPGCGYLLDPKQAYLNMEIDAANVALARLSRAELEELGVSREDQPETQEERLAKAEKLKRKAMEREAKKSS
jgi:uncharacterized Zn finger protein (UPF0148 family)